MKIRNYEIVRVLQNTQNFGPVHANPFSNKNGAFSKSFASTLNVFVSFSPVHTTTQYPGFENAFIPSIRILKWTRRMRISTYRPTKLVSFSILCCLVLLRFRILWYFPSKRCQEQLESNQKLKQGAGFQRVVLSSFFRKLARSEALKYLVSFLWNLSGASAGLNALARASKDWKSFRSRENPHGSVCPPFWILTVEWSGAPCRVYSDDVIVFR